MKVGGNIRFLMGGANILKSLKIYLLLHFLSLKPQIFRKCSFYSLKDFECWDFKILKIKILGKKNKKYRWFFVKKKFIFQKKDFLHSIFLKFNNTLSVKI